MSGQNIFDHYNKDEQPFVERIIDLSLQVSKTHEPYLSDFVDPRQLAIIKGIVNSHPDLAVFFTGGYENAERVRVLIAPDYWVTKEGEFMLAFFEIKGENKFTHIEHKDYLGALLNLGVKREKFGDILILDKTRQYIIAKEISGYVLNELKRIKNSTIELVEIEKNQLVVPREEYQVQSITVASNRADAIISQVYHLSRSETSGIIRNGRLKINWRVIEQPDTEIKIGDLISLRGFGRFKMLTQEGNTKKGRLKIKIGKLL